MLGNIKQGSGFMLRGAHNLDRLRVVGYNRGPMPADAYFQTHFVPRPERRAVWKEICAYLLPHLGGRGRVLEIGAGYCDFINCIPATERHALDRATVVREYADPEVQVHVAPCWDLSDFANSSLDLVFASNLLEHLSREELLATLCEVHRALCPGGRFVALQPNFRLCYRHYFDDYTHVQVFTDRSLPAVLAAHGLRPVRVFGRFLPYSMHSKLPKHAWLVRVYLRSPLKPFAGQMLVISEKA